MDDLVLPPVAKNITYFCKKCDEERYHRVLAHTSTIAAKIECEVCKSKKTFKITDPKKGRTMAKKVTRKVGAGSHKATYEACRTKIGSEKAASYNVKGLFEKDSAINHPKFGLGFVMESKTNKIEVVFEDSARLLVHNRS